MYSMIAIPIGLVGLTLLSFVALKFVYHYVEQRKRIIHAQTKRQKALVQKISQLIYQSKYTSFKFHRNQRKKLLRCSLQPKKRALSYLYWPYQLRDPVSDPNYINQFSHTYHDQKMQTLSSFVDSTPKPLVHANDFHDHISYLTYSSIISNQQYKSSLSN